ncbi:hypothetical protein ACFLV7_09485 [Chloroflexota bacterium]
MACIEVSRSDVGSEAAATSISPASGSVVVYVPTVAGMLIVDVCLNNTPRESECKDCCDSREADDADLKLAGTSYQIKT